MWRGGSDRLADNHICAACSAIACVAAAADRRGPLLCGAVRLPVIHHGKSAHVCPVLGRHPDVAAWSHSAASGYAQRPPKQRQGMRHRSEEHTSELQSLMRISYAVFCLKNTNQCSYIMT